jgi:protein-tyrosine-phosphatase
MSKHRVLFLRAHNAARSQMAEVLLRKHAGERFDAVRDKIEARIIDWLRAQQ